MKKILFLLIITFNIHPISAQEVKSFILDVAEYKEIVLGKDVQLVDVRTPEEYKDGFIKGAINIDYFDQKKFNPAFEKLNKNQPLYIYCRSGNRSQKSAVLLLKLGFIKIYDLKGGYIAWSNQ